jgi:hypothetical protein
LTHRHPAEREQQAALPVDRQCLPNRAGEAFDHRAIQASAPRRTMPGTQAAGVRRVVSTLQRYFVWDIELHFRWIKQSLKIRKFFGTSDNAVRTQVYIALIVFLLLHLAHAAEKISLSILEFTRLVGTHLMSRRDVRALDRPDDPPPRPDIGQYGLDWSQA